MNQTSIRKSLAAHFTNSGFVFGVSDSDRERMTQKLMGRERYGKFCDLMDSIWSGAAELHEAYAFFRSLQEANLVFSSQANVLLESSVWVASRLFQDQGKKRSLRIAEFGCGTGAFAAWLAIQKPRWEVVGFDRSRNFIEYASERYPSENLRFVEWDYSRQCEAPPTQEGFDACFTSLGVDFSRVPAFFPLEAKGIRSSPECQQLKAQSLQPFSCWASVASSQAPLLAVLRIPSEPHFVAVVDAAAESGWELSESPEVITVDQERFPALSFQKAGDEPLPLRPEEELSGFWLNPGLQHLSQAIRTGPARDELARSLFRQLADREIRRSESQSYPGGHTAECQIGVAGSFSFLFLHATTGLAELEFHPRSAVDSLQFRFPSVRVYDGGEWDD